MVGSLLLKTGASTMKRAVLYLRVSTVDQTTANQERELRAVAERAGWEIVHVYKDHGISGAKGRDKRPAYNAMLRDAFRRNFDVVMAWRVDRLGRSLQELVTFLGELHALHVDLHLHQQGIDTTMMGVFAEFERSMIQERVRAGLARARSEGKRLGRPTSRRRRKTPTGGAESARPSWRAEDRGTVRGRSIHSAADQPPFRPRGRKRRGVRVNG
jgi:DNA invertase Pin-like site-specific DNA recombinase